MVGARRGRFVAAFLHVDFETLAVLLVLPVGYFIANAEQEGPTSEIEPADEHTSEMTEMTDTVAGGAECTEELDGAHDSDEGTHGNHDREGEQPNLAVREQNCVGNQDAEDRAGRADRRSIQRPVAPEHGNNFDENCDNSSADSA